jgi:hypothetical protein
MSHSRSEVQCLLAPLQALLSQDCSMQLAVGTGPLKLSVTTPRSPVLWSTQLPGLLPVAAPASLCLQPNGSLVHSGAGGALRLWSTSAAAAAVPGPYVALIRDSALQVRPACPHQPGLFVSRFQCIQVLVRITCMLGPPHALLLQAILGHCTVSAMAHSTSVGTCCLSPTHGSTWHCWHACSKPNGPMTAVGAAAPLVAAWVPTELGGCLPAPAEAACLLTCMTGAWLLQVRDASCKLLWSSNPAQVSRAKKAAPPPKKKGAKAGPKPPIGRRGSTSLFKPPAGQRG